MYGRSRCFVVDGLNFVRFRQMAQIPDGRRVSAPFLAASWNATATESSAISLKHDASVSSENGKRDVGDLDLRRWLRRPRCMR